jgi:hypothetical protein
VGRFQNLSQVGQVLADVIVAAMPGTTVVMNVPPENPEALPPSVRVSLLWTTPQPGHRSDPPERNLDGTLAPPPATLTAWYLVSTYGQTAENNAIDAHDLLGNIIRIFHAQRTVPLPVGGNGEGAIDVIQVPVDHELCEKVWVPLQTRLRPWVVFDIGPIQLLRADAAPTVQPLVHPGGVHLGDIEVAQPPRIERIAPSVIGEGGRVRIDGTYAGAPSLVMIGTNRHEPPDIAAMAPGGPVLVTLTNQVGVRDFTITLRGAGPVMSEPEVLTVVPATVPSVDAPDVLTHSRALPLVLEGRELGVGAVDVFFWPDAGISAPNDVIVAPANAATTTVTIPALSLAPLAPRLYRVSVHHPPHGFTPYVVLEIVP